MTESERYKVISRLQQLIPPKDIAEDLSVSYGGVLKLKREFEEAVIAGTVDSLVDSDKLLLASVGQELQMEEEVKTLTTGLDGLENLSSELQRTALNINIRINSLVLSATDLSELSVAADTLCNLQSAFLNKNMTQVNVQNNFGGEAATPKYAQYLSDVPESNNG